MAIFDRRLVRPSVLQLVECLQEASATAGMSRDHDEWQNFIDDIRNEPEGFQQEGTHGIVSIAWWTDFEKRRHFRVQAVAAGSPEYRLVAWQPGWSRPALWHVY